MNIETNQKLVEAFRNLEPVDELGAWSPEEVFDAVHGDLDADRKLQLIDMARLDPELADAFRIARAVPLADRSAPAVAPRSRKAWGWAAAAVLLLGLATAALLVPRLAENEPVFRDSGDYSITSTVEAAEGLARDQFKLTWTNGPEGTTYFAEAADADLNVLYSKRHLKEAELSVPSESLSELAPGSAVIWRVEAYLDDGRTVRSPTFRTLIVD